MVKRLIALASVLSLASVARANPPDTIGFASRGVALGGAVGADVADPSAGYYNPGGLAREDQLRIALGYSSAQSNLAIDDRDSNVERIGGLSIGLVAPLRIHSVGLAFGLAVFLPDQRVSRTRTTLFDRPRWELYDTRPHKISLATNLALRPVSWLSFGGGITFQSPSDLVLAIRGSADLFEVDAARLEHEFQGDLLSIRYPQVGVQVTPHAMLALGLTYRGSLTVRTALTATVDGTLTGSTDPIPLRFRLTSRGVSTFVPQQLVGSVAFRPVPTLRLGLDVQWLDWSKHPSLVARDEVELEIEAPPGLGLNLPDEIIGREPIPMNLHDRVVPRFGVEWTAVQNDTLELDLRAGYAFERSPFPLQRGVTNFLDSDRHSISVGAGLRLVDLRPTLNGVLAFDLHAVYSPMPDRTHVKTSLVDPVGDYVAGGHQWMIGGNVEVRFE